MRPNKPSHFEPDVLRDGAHVEFHVPVPGAGVTAARY
jgi:hypothetical protein